MKKLTLIGLSAILATNMVMAEDTVWPPSEDDIINKLHLMDKTYEHPENIKKGVTLFITSYNHNKKTYNVPIVYGKIEQIKKNKTVNGTKCDAFTNDPSGQYGWKCLTKLKQAPQTTQDNLYLTRFDDPAFNDGKPFKAAPPKDEFDEFVK
ncbi:MAG: hypothetical protein SPE33_09725 [[Pasteurella] aerogenes]|nr:hypothetical protein [[Pasteurella] aerogenes]